MKFKFNHLKNEQLLNTRNIGFEEIIVEIERGNIIKISKHYNYDKYPNQEIIYVRVIDTVYMVPYIKELDGSIFLKTLYPSRKATKLYLKLN